MSKRKVLGESSNNPRVVLAKRVSTNVSSVSNPQVDQPSITQPILKFTWRHFAQCTYGFATQLRSAQLLLLEMESFLEVMNPRPSSASSASSSVSHSQSYGPLTSNKNDDNIAGIETPTGCGGSLKWTLKNQEVLNKIQSFKKIGFAIMVFTGTKRSKARTAQKLSRMFEDVEQRLRLDAHFLIIEREALSTSDLVNAILELQEKEKDSPPINFMDSICVADRMTGEDRDKDKTKGASSATTPASSLNLFSAEDFLNKKENQLCRSSSSGKKTTKRRSKNLIESGPAFDVEFEQERSQIFDQNVGEEDTDDLVFGTGEENKMQEEQEIVTTKDAKKAEEADDDAFFSDDDLEAEDDFLEKLEWSDQTLKQIIETTKNISEKLKKAENEIKREDAGVLPRVQMVTPRRLNITGGEEHHLNVSKKRKLNEIIITEASDEIEQLDNLSFEKTTSSTSVAPLETITKKLKTTNADNEVT